MKVIGRFLRVLVVLLAVFALAIIVLFGHSDLPLQKLKDKYAKIPSSFITVNGMEVHYRDEGPRDSVPLVLIHGTGSSLHTFNAWAGALKTEFRVIRMDLPGYGLTGPFPFRNYSIENYVRFINEFLDQLGIKNCIIGGNSLGGKIAWSFTIEYPEMVNKLVLIDASGYPTEAQSEPVAFKLAKVPILKNAFTYITPKFVVKSSVKNVYADKSKVTQALVDRYFELALREGNRQAFVDRLGAKNNPNAYKTIPTIKQPTLILWGDRDELIPVENAHKFHSDLPNSTLVVFKNLGHVPMEEEPKESLVPLLTFLR